jgi:hypothetical protein
MIKLIRFWFEFDFTNSNIPFGLGLGCGVTAWNYDDALTILKEKVFVEFSLPTIKKVDMDVDIMTLDKGHVLPNMLPPNISGIWYTLGYNY